MLEDGYWCRVIVLPMLPGDDPSNSAPPQFAAAVVNRCETGMVTPRMFPRPAVRPKIHIMSFSCPIARVAALRSDILILHCLRLRRSAHQDHVSTAMGCRVCGGMAMRGPYAGLFATFRPAQTIPYPYLQSHFARNRHIVLAVAGSDDQRSGMDRSMQQNTNGAGSQPGGRQRICISLSKCPGLTILACRSIVLTNLY